VCKSLESFIAGSAFLMQNKIFVGHISKKTRVMMMGWLIVSDALVHLFDASLCKVLPCQIQGCQLL
jgi:hypothetical protein